MKAIILAAGRGKRMRHLTKHQPKALIRVAGRPLLDHIFAALPKEVDEVIVVIGYRGDRIREHFGDTYRGKRIFYLEQQTLDGTARPVLAARKFFTKAHERFLIIYGDELIRARDVRACLRSGLSWLCIRVPRPHESGIVTLSARGNRILRITEKPKRPSSDLAGGGLMLVNTDLFSYKPERHPSGEYPLALIMNSFVASHRVRAVFGRPLVSFSTPEDIRRYNDKKRV